MLRIPQVLQTFRMFALLLLWILLVVGALYCWSHAGIPVWVGTRALSLETIIFRMFALLLLWILLMVGALYCWSHTGIYTNMSTYRALFVSRNERIGTRMRLAWTYYLWSNIIQRTVSHADRLHACKQSVAWPRHSDIADYYLQSGVRFRRLLHYYDRVIYIYISGGLLPSARHNILLIAFAYHC